MTAALAPVTYGGMRVSEEDYWAWYYEGPKETYEWNNGVLEEKGVSDHLTLQDFDWFILLLVEYLRAHPIAELVGLETGFRLALPDKTAIRRPDYGLILNANPRPIAGTDNSYKGIFDVCIEGLSTSNRAQRDRDLVVKKAEYAAAGVREYYILHHRAALRAFYRLGPHGLYEPIPVSDDGVIASAVLPGLRWRLADLDDRPTLGTLRADPVYQGFVALDLQRVEAEHAAERARADQATADAATERARADQATADAAAERARAERLADRLRALGIAPD